MGYGVQHTRQKSHVVDEQHASSLFMAGFSAILYGGVAIAMVRATGFLKKTACISESPCAT